MLCGYVLHVVLTLSLVAGYEVFFFFQAEDGIRDVAVTGVQTCALPISGSIQTFERFLFRLMDQCHCGQNDMITARKLSQHSYRIFLVDRLSEDLTVEGQDRKSVV